MPIENSTEGTVNNTLDRFLNSPLKICGEVELRMHHCLMGRDDGSARRSSASARIRSRWRNAAAWLDEHLPEAERVPVSSNAEGGAPRAG